MLSKACSYGLLAVMYVAKANRSSYVPIREICDELGISFHFLTKILQGLTQAGWLVSHTGPKGGVSLAKPASDISLLDIIHAIDGPQLFSECILGLPGCGHEKPCPMHTQWAATREDLKRMFRERNLSTTSEDLDRLGLRLRLS
jgi:Rrf2 family protein